MKFQIRTRDGELTVGSYAELRVLYQRQFVGDDDEVRREGSDRWVKAGTMPDLQAIKPKPWLHGFEFAWLVAAIAILSLVLVLLMGRR